MNKKNETSKIVEFFRNSTIFLTGGTGFVGKMMISKLLSTCEVSRIYLLIRKKSSKSGTERLEELFDDPIFIPLKNKFPDYGNRVKVIEGDCSVKNLGLSANDEEILRNSVEFVIHCAATMNFMGSFKTSVEINVQGTLQLINLASKMINLKTFVYVSSLGGFFDQNPIEEKLYDSHLDYKDCLNLLKIDHVLPMDKYDKKRIAGNKVVIYSLTKCAAENIFIRENISFPVVIFRFGLATSSWKEPITGCVPDFYGPNGFLALGILGMVPAIYYKKSTIIDAIPVDSVVNALLAVTQHSYDKFQRHKKNNEKITPAVYNYSSQNYNKTITPEKYIGLLKREFSCFPSLYQNKVMFLFRIILTAYIPTLLIDLVAPLFRKNPSVSAFQTCDELVEENLGIIEANWCQPVNDNNLQNCWRNLNETDRKLFSFDLNELNWDEFIPMIGNYAREYLQIQTEKDQDMRLVVFWMPKIRLGLKILYLATIVGCIHFIYTVGRIYYKWPN